MKQEPEPTSGVAAAATIGCEPLSWSEPVTDEPFAHVLPKLSPLHVPRPRLTAALDGARAQAIVLYAPAGYGKTSLAVEWLKQRRSVAWFTAQPDAGDVGAAAIGVASAASRLVPGAADRIRQRLSVVEEPASAALTLAEILAEDLADWPSGGVIAIDDYQHLAASDAAEAFINRLLLQNPSLTVLIATRRRRAWASAKRVLAGDILELDQRALAMTDAEVAAIIGSENPAEIQPLLAKAEGWPAVVGLAALSDPGWEDRAAPGLTDDVFRYFAEEVLRSMTSDERRFVLVASVPRSLTPQLARALIGGCALPRLETLRDRGLLTEESDGSFRFHPMLRDFLLKEHDRQDSDGRHDIASQLLEQARDEERWEDASTRHSCCVIPLPRPMSWATLHRNSCAPDAARPSNGGSRLVTMARAGGWSHSCESNPPVPCRAFRICTKPGAGRRPSGGSERQTGGPRAQLGRAGGSCPRGSRRVTPTTPESKRRFDLDTRPHRVTFWRGLGRSERRKLQGD